MPANVAVSYNTNSLVVPHARLFNDSSICLSPDGRLLAAFVVPRVDINATGTIEDLRNPDSRRSSLVIGGSSESETLLAVYRLEPRKNRGACLFSHRFASVSPVCLDFSPLADYIVVGLATTRLPCLNRSPTGHADISNSQHASMNSSHSKHYRTEFTKPGDSTPASMTSVGKGIYIAK
ncbi:unnamed protein product [Protopolystoma xenopodis]|uniref:Uncharacterized protein n=1 Tax=Protopolystoma xenopodis TaxID=117903 RepID=A0A3S5BZU3_9PLAT|nr:unnamed protein product [Protopolystoma xenopodis]